MTDLTIIYITANKLTDFFAENIRTELKKAAGDIPIISISKKPVNLGTNIVMDGPCSLYNEYKETLIGVKEAETKYVAICEDDSLYTSAHFAHVPQPNTFEFNVGCWGVYTWSNPVIYSMKFRKNHNALMCERDLYIKAMKERLTKYPDENNYPQRYWGEPGRYEKGLGITVNAVREFTSNPPIVRFSHEQDCFGWQAMGKTKKHGDIRAYDIPYWGKADELLKRIYGRVQAE